jgi:8-oxo-dGTP pyrophosphatase MutT (NUDIX family)
MNLPQHHDLPTRLAARLQYPLPGPTAHLAYQPELSYGRHNGPAPTSARQAAVLALLYPRDNTWHLPLTLRPPNLVDHASQISLPGGTIEPDERSQDAATRELTEELGVSTTTNVEVLGQLSPIYVFRTNYLVTPWLASTNEMPAWQPNPSEVAELLEIPLPTLLDPATAKLVERISEGITFGAPSFIWQGHEIWGATAMILAELVALVRDV